MCSDFRAWCRAHTRSIYIYSANLSSKSLFLKLRLHACISPPSAPLLHSLSLSLSVAPTLYSLPPSHGFLTSVHRSLSLSLPIFLPPPPLSLDPRASIRTDAMCRRPKPNYRQPNPLPSPPLTRCRSGRSVLQRFHGRLKSTRKAYDRYLNKINVTLKIKI